MILGIDWITFVEFLGVGVFAFIMGVKAEKERYKDSITKGEKS